MGSWTIPASVSYSLDPFYVITIGLVFSWLWYHLAKKGRDPSIPTKFSTSLIFMGFGFLIFILGIHHANVITHLVGKHWILLGYLFLTIAELLIAPIGYAMVGRLSPVGKEGLLMGIWTVFIGLGSIISGYLANLAVIPKNLTLVQSNVIYSKVFLHVGMTTIVLGLIIIPLIPFIKKLIHSNPGTVK